MSVYVCTVESSTVFFFCGGFFLILILGFVHYPVLTNPRLSILCSAISNVSLYLCIFWCVYVYIILLQKIDLLLSVHIYARTVALM